MMATTAVIGLRAGKMPLGASSYYSDVSEKISCNSDIGFVFGPTKTVITAKMSSDYSHSFLSKRDTHPIRALKEHVDTASNHSSVNEWVQRFDHLEEEGSEHESSIDALLLLKKSLLEKQWNLSVGRTMTEATPTEKGSKKTHVIRSGISARRRRIDALRKTPNSLFSVKQVGANKQLSSIISPELLQNHSNHYVRGLTGEVLLTHSEVVVLSKKIKIGLRIEEQKSRLKDKLGSEPSEEQLAKSLRISRADLRIKQIEYSLAREKLTMSNVRLVMSIAQKYDKKGAEMADLIQGGLIGLLRGIKKYDSSRGFRISTYVYWWILQGVSKVLNENSRILRLPTHLHQRQSAIRNAKARLEERGITPSIDKIAESLNMSRQKVMNATEAMVSVSSLDREVFPSLSGIPGETYHSYIADTRPEYDPWHGVYQKALKDEVNELLKNTLREREIEIIRLYYGLDNEFLTWEDIGKRIGLSRERVRQIGIVAIEKLKHAARKSRLETMLFED